MEKKLAEIKAGQAFTYGGVEWAKLDEENGGTLTLATKVLFIREFGESNNWAKVSLREELNGRFLRTLIENGAEESAFLPMTVDLTADDGLDDYGTTTDTIAMLTCDQYRKYRRLIPLADDPWWTVTPTSCESREDLHSVRSVYSSGALNYSGACGGGWGIRPLCNLRSDTLVYTKDEEGTTEPQSLEDRVASLERKVHLLEVWREFVEVD